MGMVWKGHLNSKNFWKKFGHRHRYRLHWHPSSLHSFDSIVFRRRKRTGAMEDKRLFLLYQNMRKASFNDYKTNPTFIKYSSLDFKIQRWNVPSHFVWQSCFPNSESFSSSHVALTLLQVWHIPFWGVLKSQNSKFSRQSADLLQAKFGKWMRLFVH